METPVPPVARQRDPRVLDNVDGYWQCVSGLLQDSPGGPKLANDTMRINFTGFPVNGSSLREGVYHPLLATVGLFLGTDHRETSDKT